MVHLTFLGRIQVFLWGGKESGQRVIAITNVTSHFDVWGNIKNNKTYYGKKFILSQQQ